MHELSLNVFTRHYQFERVLDWIDNQLPLWINGQNPEEGNFGKILNIFWDDVLQAAPIFKDKAFEEEAEWRLISSKRKHALQLEGLDFRSGENMIIPHLPFKLPTKEQGEHRWSRIDEITVGPTAYPESSHTSVGQLLLASGFCGHVSSISTVPFRKI